MLYGDELDTSLIVKIVVLSSWKNVEAKITPLQKKIPINARGRRAAERIRALGRI